MLKERNRTIRHQILPVLAKSIAEDLETMELDFNHLQEIRLRTDKPMVMIYKGEEIFAKDRNGNTVIVKGREVKETLDYVSNYSLYAYENELRQGFITIEGGHRVGMAGQTMVEQEKVKNMKYISSVNIRISHEVKGCAEKVMPYICRHGELCHTLIISPPRCGKTTLLRDIVRQASDGCKYMKGTTVGVVDERSEIGGCYMGTAQNDLGIRTDVLDCCPKAEGMLMLIRSMSPRILAVDEIGAKEEIQAIEYALHCGCIMLATAHGSSMEEMKKKPLFEELIAKKRFERYVILSNRAETGGVEEVYDEKGKVLCRNSSVQY